MERDSLATPAAPQHTTFGDQLNSSMSAAAIAEEIRRLFRAGDTDSAIMSIDAAIEQWNDNTRELVKALGRTVSASRSLEEPDRKRVLQAIRNIELNNPNMNEALYNLLRPNFGNSYRQQRYAFNAVRGKLSPRLLANKARGRQFAAHLGLSLPEVYQLDVPGRQVHIDRPSVVKPSSEDGGRGVYGVDRDGDRVHDRFHTQTYETIDDFRAELARQVERRYIRNDSWIVEELISGPDGVRAAPDVKFYSFYGEIGYVLQVDRWREDGKSYTFFTPDGVAVDTGKYKFDSAKQEPVFTREDIQLAARISQEIPWPAVRIDFLASNRGLIFGEFTFEPGAGGSFNKAADTYLGEHFAQAHGRLLDDLISGKRFTTFTEFLNEYLVAKPELQSAL